MSHIQYELLSANTRIFPLSQAEVNDFVKRSAGANPERVVKIESLSKPVPSEIRKVPFTEKVTTEKGEYHR